MRVRNVARSEDKVELMMTPMIDIVFLLLIFFLLTLRITEREGDFAIKMPQAPQAGKPDVMDTMPIVVSLVADNDGELKGILINPETAGSAPLNYGRDYEKLRAQIRSLVGDDAGPGALAEYQVQFKADFDLRYKWVMRAITYVSGYYDESTGKIRALVENIHFIPSARVMEANI